MENDKFYMPFVPRSPIDDLTYDYIIEVMEFMDSEEDEKQVLQYFHDRLSLHAVAASFDPEHIRNFPADRKLSAWKVFEDYRVRTPDSARKAKPILYGLKQEALRDLPMKTCRRVKTCRRGKRFLFS